jgi:hypothetical protein
MSEMRLAIEQTLGTAQYGKSASEDIDFADVERKSETMSGGDGQC